METVWKIIISIIVLASIYLVAANVLNLGSNPQNAASRPELKQVSTDGSFALSGASDSKKASAVPAVPRIAPIPPKAPTKAKPKGQS